MEELVILSDVHTAKVWDEIEKKMPKSYHFLQPNRNLKNYLKKLDPKKILIINGDLIDYYYTEYNAKNGSENRTNWLNFFNILNIFKGKIYLTLGNHDYRRFPYNFALYGLKHLNISNKVRRQYLKGLFDKFRWFNELKSFFINLSEYNPEKMFSSSRFNKEQLKNYDLLFFSTGPDAFTKPINLLKIKSWLGLFVFQPNSYGLDEDQMNFLNLELKNKSNKETILFIHSPLMFHKKKIRTLHLKVKSFLYNFYLREIKMTYGSFIKNNRNFFFSLINSEKNVILVSSHVHIARQYLIDKKTLNLIDCTMNEINKYRKNSRFIKIISTMPFGAINKDQMQTGSLHISSNNIFYKIYEKF